MLDKYTTKELLDELTSRNEDVPPNGSGVTNVDGALELAKKIMNTNRGKLEEIKFGDDPSNRAYFGFNCQGGIVSYSGKKKEQVSEPTFKDNLLDNQETIVKIVKQALAREGKTL